MTVETFAEQHKLRLRRDECGEQFILCRLEQIFDHGDSRFGVMVLNDSPRGWGNARRSMEAAHFQIIQDGEDEGTALFNPADRQQVKMAFKVAKPCRRKKLSEETLAKLCQQIAIARSIQKSLNSEAPGSQDSIAGLG